MRVGRVAAQDEQRDARARRAAQHARARERRHVARRLAVDHAEKVARAQSGLRRRRSVLDAHDANVELTRDDEPDAGRRKRRARFDRVLLFGQQIRARRVEAVGQPAHRAVHHLVHVHGLDVAARDELDDLPEQPQVRKRLLTGRRRRRGAQQPAHAHEQHQGRRNQQNQEAGLEGHESIIRHGSGTRQEEQGTRHWPECTRALASAFVGPHCLVPGA